MHCTLKVYYVIWFLCNWLVYIVNDFNFRIYKLSICNQSQHLIMLVICFPVSVSLLRDLPEEKLAKIVDCLEIVSMSHFMTFLYNLYQVPYIFRLYQIVVVDKRLILFFLCRTILKKGSILSERVKRGTLSLLLQKERWDIFKPIYFLNPYVLDFVEQLYSWVLKILQPTN